MPSSYNFFSILIFFVVNFSSPPPESSLSRLIEPRKWVVRYAPPPEDIYWENITDSHSFYVAKAFIINILMFLLLVNLFGLLKG